MAAGVWATRELPVLEAIAALEASGDPAATEQELLEATGLDAYSLSIALRALFEGEFLTGVNHGLRGSGEWHIEFVRLLPAGRVAVGQWPSGDPLTAVLAELDVRIHAEGDPVQRTRLEALRAAATEVGKDVLSGVAVALATSALR